jgi:hypothetical protein
MTEMIKETNVQTEVVEQHKFCDVCGAEIHIGLACSSARCMYCGKDLCEECIGYEEGSPGDCRIVWCKHCWEIGEYYRPKIAQLGVERDRLYAEWRSKCIESKIADGLSSLNRVEAKKK